MKAKQIIGSILLAGTVLLASCGSGNAGQESAEEVSAAAAEISASTETPVSTETPALTETPTPEPTQVLTPAPAESTPDPTEAVTPVPEKTEEKLPVIGMEQEGDKVCRLVIANDSNVDFSAVTVKHEYLPEWPENMLPDGEVFSAGEKRILYYNTEEAEKASETNREDDLTDPEEPVKSPEYSIRFTDKDGMEYILHNFPFGDLEEGTIRLTEDVLWIEYRSMKTEEVVKTLESERAIKEKESVENTGYSEQQYSEPVYEEPVYEAPVYEEPVYEEPVYEEPVYEEPVYEAPVYEEPAYTEPVPADTGAADPNQGCLGDGALTY